MLLLAELLREEKKKGLEMATNELKTKLRAALMLAQPKLKKDYLYDRCVNSYVDGMLAAIRDAWAMNRDTK